MKIYMLIGRDGSDVGAGECVLGVYAEAGTAEAEAGRLRERSRWADSVSLERFLRELTEEFDRENPTTHETTPEQYQSREAAQQEFRRHRIEQAFGPAVRRLWGEIPESWLDAPVSVEPWEYYLVRESDVICGPATP